MIANTKYADDADSVHFANMVRDPRRLCRLLQDANDKQYFLQH